MKSLEINKDISFYLFKKKLNDSIFVLILKKGLNVIYLTSKWEILRKGRTLLSKGNTINVISMALKSLEEWNKRELEIKGVGSKAIVEEGKLAVTVSNTDHWFEIPKDVYVKVQGSPLKIILWGPNINTIDSFKLNIIKKAKFIK